MSRPKSIDSLLDGPASEIAPTVTDVSKREQTEPAAGPKPEPVEPAKAPVREKRKPTTREPVERRRAAIRFQVSAPEGGEVESALEDILAAVPKTLRSGISIGTLFRQVLIENDAEIAAMIRKSVEG
jgi:hypothetical protein